MNRTIPAWIWHQDNMNRRTVTLTKRFTLTEEGNDFELYLAVLGETTVELDGKEIGRLEEHPQYIAAFTKMAGFPNRLSAGNHEISIHVTCSEAMPVGPISIHLNKRLVGCNAFLAGSNLWIATDATWITQDGTQASMICLLGEEPYGDLENGPEWFIAGGFGDIRAEPILSVSLLKTNHLAASQSDHDANGQLRIQGTLREELQLKAIDRSQRDIFYHLRKQREWQHLRAIQTGLDQSEIPVLIVDLKKEYNARFQLANLGKDEITVLWNGAESLYELEHYDGCITESFIVQPGNTFFVLPQGMRYAALYFYGANGAFFDVRAVFEEVCVPLEQIGKMDSDLPLLNEIYEVSVHTNRVCHQLGLWDGIKRDRLNWAYDFYLAAKGDYVLWNDFSVLKRSIKELGKTPYGYWMNSIPSYTFWWMNNLWEYYFFTGDREFLIEIKQDLHTHLQWIRENIDLKTGSYKTRHQSFIEWVPMGLDESMACLHALIKITLDNLKALGTAIPELEIHIDWPAPVMRETDFFPSEALITPMLGIAAGYISESTAKQFIATYEAKDPITPLCAYWYAECCSKFGMHDKAWHVVSTVWGKMLNEDATTFWEGVTLEHESDSHIALTTYTDYDKYRMSLCHSWASTPVQWVSRFILGVEPLEPGYKRISFKPNALPGQTSCSGTINTPVGPIQVKWSVQPDGTLKSSIDAPEEIVIE